MIAMISQPMTNRTEEDILKEKTKAELELKKKGYDVINTFFNDEWANKERLLNDGIVNIPVAFLGKSIEHMSKCHAVYFCSGWETTRGCKIEHAIATAYGLTIFYEEE